MAIPINEQQQVMNRISALLAERNMSLAEFARSMGVLSSYVSNWKKRGIPVERVPRAVDILGISVDQLLGRATDQPEGSVPVLLSGRIPIVGEAQLGDGGYYAEFERSPAPEGYLPIPSRDPDAFAVRCRGTSMTPRIQPGEYVIVEPSIEATPGDEVLVEAIDGRVMVKRYLYKKAGNVYLGSVNESHPNIVLSLDNIRRISPVLAIVQPKLVQIL